MMLPQVRSIIIIPVGASKIKEDSAMHQWLSPQLLGIQEIL